MREKSNRRHGRIFLWAVPTIGGTALAYSVADLISAPPTIAWFALTGFATLISSRTIRIPGSVVKLSVSEPLVFLSTLLYGASAGTVTAAVDAIVLSLRLSPRLRTFHRIAFNVGALAISVWPSSHLYFWLTKQDPRSPSYVGIDSFVIPLYVFASTVFVLNTALVATAVAIEKNTSPLKVWRAQFSAFSASYLASAAIAAILVVLINAGDLAMLSLLVPLIVASGFAVRTTLGRLNDEHQHLLELNRLHLSTIETLAMAIDAKDQVTHGHIRRVQRYAVALARSLGVTDEKQVRAIEAAALLHDMGKLAIPEFILNKPGKLTPREFAVMKTHAAVGADLLSSIHFPYPVVPIVRHHHENWDGTGYPDGLRGADIPVGARILAVVDCYDALTSHRPYRPALSTEAALEILTQRRGRMYDPLVVDAFIREHAALGSTADLAIPERPVLSPPYAESSVEPDDSSADPGAPTVNALSVLAELAPFPAGQTISSVATQIYRHLRALTALDGLALYVADDTSSHIRAVSTHGDRASSLATLSIPIGERLSGWVAAHKTAVWNSDAALDLVDHETRPGSASSLPLSVDGALVAVLTLYAPPDRLVSVTERRAIEALVPAATMAIFAAINRPGAAMDCRQDEIKSVALVALEEILAREHATTGRDVEILALTVHTGTVCTLADLDNAVTEIARTVSPPGRGNRFVMRFTDGGLLCCVPSETQIDALVARATLAARQATLLQLDLAATTISSSLELQEAHRRMVEHSRLSGATSAAIRVH